MKITAQPKVILRDCSSYDPDRIRALVREAIDELDLEPFGRTLVKPNLVAAGKQFRHAHTRPEVLEGVLGALQDRGARIEELAVGERCGITIPTRMAFAEAGVDRMLERAMPGVKRYLFDEETQLEVELTHPERLRDRIYVPEPVLKADFFVNVPKFKAHPWTTVTFSMKNYIGIQDDRHRLIDHDHRLDDKVADLQHVIQPQLICVDGVIAGEGRMLTPKPFDLRLLILGNSQVAVDSVCCRIIGVDPASVAHIRRATEHGFGSTALEDVALSGDVSLEEARRRGEGFEVGLVRVERYFEGSRIRAYAGPPPEPKHTDYCWGGCPGAIEEAIEILRQFDERCDAKMRPLHVVFGDYRGPIDARDDETVVFIGDCARWRGTLRGEIVEVESTYAPRETKDPDTVRHEDVFAKLLKTVVAVQRARKRRWLRIRGCPVSVAEQVMALSTLGGVKNPIFDPHEGLQFNLSYLKWRFETTKQRLKGTPYQRAGRCPRGAATPDL